MSYYIDLKYAGMMSSRLRNFKQFKPGFFRFSHSCESTQGKQKARCYMYPKGTGLNVFCHHCQYSVKFSTFIKDVDVQLHKEYILESFTDSGPKSFLPMVEEKKEVKVIDSSALQFLDTLPSTHPVFSYVNKRQIPKEFFSRIAFVADFNKFASKIDENFRKVQKSVPRLIFPYYDENDNIISYSARAFGKEMPKYIKLILDSNVENIYGLWRIDKAQPIIVVEGQIDSLFLKNSVAVSGADYSKKFIRENKSNIIICPDSDFVRNPQVAGAVRKAIEAGFKISFLPEDLPFKDINDCVVKGGMTGDFLTNTILENARSDGAAQLEFIFRKRC